ncbi:S8 family serine peptidase [Enterococcus plantarum]|nr:S8 family serine peptidase [Enterococcus plantarum]
MRYLIHIILVSVLGAFAALSLGISAFGENQMNLVEQTFLLNDKKEVTQLTQLVYDINPSIKQTVIEEIDMVHLENVTPEELETIENITQIEKISGKSGQMSKVETESIKLTDVTTNFEDVKRIDNTRALFSRKSSSLLDLLSWHVDDVTSNKQSYAIATGKNIKVAVIDSGIDTESEYFQKNLTLENAKSFVSNDQSIIDENGHGTMVTGVLTQVAPDVKITPYKVINATTGESVWTIQAIIQAVKDKNQIINLSLGTYKNDKSKEERLTIKAYERAIKFAKKNHVFVLASAGNDGLDLDALKLRERKIHLPGGMKNLFTIGATRKNDNKSSYSNYGKEIDFVAPGGDIYNDEGQLDLNEFIFTTYPVYLDNGLGSLGIPQGYMFSGGTSLATPAVSGVVATIYEKYYQRYGIYPQNQVVNKLLKAGGVDIGTPGLDKYFGYGKVNGYQSLSKIN